MAESNLRLRQNASESKAEKSSRMEIGKKNLPPATPKQKRGIGILDILSMLLGVAIVSSASSYYINRNVWWNRRPSWTRYNRLYAFWHGHRSLTPEELLPYDGTNKWLPIYMAINNTVYDVSASPHFYGPGGGYHIFAGRDSTRAFITGCFDDDWTSDLRGVEELYMPRDLDSPPKLGEDATEAEKKAARKLWKLRRNAASREGKLKAQQTIETWVQRFESGMGGKYFRVGEVKLPDDWKEKRGSLRNLCSNAQASRPETNHWSTWDGKD